MPTHSDFGLKSQALLNSCINNKAFIESALSYVNGFMVVPMHETNLTAPLQSFHYIGRTCGANCMFCDSANQRM